MRLRADEVVDQCPTRGVSLYGILLPERPRNIVTLQLLVQLQAMSTQELQQGKAENLLFAAKPALLDYGVQRLCELVRQCDLDRFHTPAFCMVYPRCCKAPAIGS